MTWTAPMTRHGVAHVFDTLAPGPNTFTMKHWAASGIRTFSNRELIVMPL